MRPIQRHRSWTTGRFTMLCALSLMAVASNLWAGRMQCPDSADGIHPRDILATSAPEIKVSQAAKDDEARFSKITRPLTLKAIKLAKAQRAAAIEEGIEQSCPSNLVYVAQLVPFPDKPSGCDHRVVTRTADNGALYVQAVATCKYTWSCCVPEATGKPSPVSYKLEGPLNPNPEDDITPPASAKSTKKKAD